MSVFQVKDLNSTVNTTKGTDVYEGLLLDQYRNSPNLKAYAGAFLAEFDFLFEQVERVYLGRFLEYAVGVQLTNLGIIVGLPRNITVEDGNFGFNEEIGAESFGTSGDAAVGDVFRSSHSITLQLSDDIYRRAVRAKALCNSAEFQSVDFMYEIIAILLGQIPSTLHLRVDEAIPWRDLFGFSQDAGAEAFGTVGDNTIGGAFVSETLGYSYEPLFHNRIILTLEEAAVPSEVRSLIYYMRRYFVPSGYQFVFNLI